MTAHKTGTREEWLAARLELLEAEKVLTRRSDELARWRQELPWVRIDKEYRFEIDEGTASLADLFRGRSQLLIYHFMYGAAAAVGSRRVQLSQGQHQLTHERNRCERGRRRLTIPTRPTSAGWTGSGACSSGSTVRHSVATRPAPGGVATTSTTTSETMDTQRKRTMMSDLSGRTTVVVGASRGLGRGIARAFAEAGAPVVAVARTGPALAELATTSANIRTEVADAADATVAWSLLDQYEPEVLILVAGANPVMRPLQYQTWETFSVNWHTDVKIAFTWLREALLKPLPPSSRVVVMSSGAAINGSPASGGYAGSKATQRFIAVYAQEEARRAGLDMTVTAVMPRMTPFGDVGRRGVRAYATRDGQTEEAYLKQMGELLTPEIAGAALVDLVRANPATTAPGYLLTAAGLQKLP